MAEERQLPDWDLSAFFTETGNEAYAEFTNALRNDLGRLLAAADHAAEVQAITRLEEIDARLGHLESYLYAAGAADSTDELVQREIAALAELNALMEKAKAAMRAALGELDDDKFDSLVTSESGRPIAYQLARERRKAKLSMSAEQENLAADLGVNGLGAWGRLYDQVSGKLTFQLEVAGQSAETLPVSMTRSLLEHPDETVRKAALSGSNRAWEQVADTTAACLNGIAGTRLTLYERRGIDHFLDPALFDAGISRETIDAMMTAVSERKGVAATYYQYKAKLLGKEKLGWHDLSAPSPSDTPQTLEWAEAKERIIEAFAGTYPDLAEFTNGAFAGKWIDYQPRPGKRPGGFCTGSHLLGESRIFMTYGDTPGDAMTLAHELGHAFHGSIMNDMRYWQTRYPMTLAETASTFAEAMVADALMNDERLSEKGRLAILDRNLSDAAIMLCNIPARYYFEYSLYEERARGELSVSRLKQLMIEAQQRAYGDALAPGQLNPWFWASKLHFYISDLSFYNFPYTFGYLFSLGLFARVKEEGVSFLATYENLLRDTGSKTAEQVAKDNLGVDISQPEFWNSSIDLIAADLGRYVEAFTWGQV